MFEQVSYIIHLLIGTNPIEQITCMQMVLRAGILYFFGIVLVRIHSRFFGLKTAHDMLLRIIIGSIFANAIIGRAPFFCSIVVPLFMILLNWLIAFISFRSHAIEIMVKGSHYILVDDGNIVWKNMRYSSITKDELLETARIKAHTQDIHRIKKAYLENDGEISIVLFENN